VIGLGKSARLVTAYSAPLTPQIVDRGVSGAEPRIGQPISIPNKKPLLRGAKVKTDGILGSDRSHLDVADNQQLAEFFRIYGFLLDQHVRKLIQDGTVAHQNFFGPIVGNRD
jgi:hypothetical protein